jgi:hypothetical protein
MKRALGWAGMAVVAFCAALFASSGTTGVVHAAIYGLAISPGIVLGRRATGPGQPAGILIGALVGYGTSQIALWLPIFLGMASAPVFVLSWLAHAGVLLAIARRIREPLIVLPAWTRADSRALALTLLLVPVLMGPPYRNLGAVDESGTRWYRAYFTADFVWHTALAAELGRYDSPPRNPYMASRTMHYYWTYFLLPSVAAREVLGDVQGVLKANAMLSAPLLIGMMFLLARAAVPRPGPAAAAVALTVVATSAEGAYLAQQVWRDGESLSVLANTNIDAISSWEFDGLRIDGLARGLWYNPQHSVSCALGLIAALIAAVMGAGASRGAIWLAGAALGLATTFNPFIGAVFCAVYGLGVLLDAVGRPDAVRLVLRHTEAAAPVALALMWCFVNQVADGAGTAVQVGWLIGLAGNHTLTVLLISTGPVLLPALLGLWPWRGLPAQPARVAWIGAGLALVLMHTLTLSESSWVGFRTGQILQLMLPVLLARVLWVLGRFGAAWPLALALPILAAGLPTTVVDTFNAQDIRNHRFGPGFHWTMSVTPAQQEAFVWIRQTLPAAAVVQMEPRLRGAEHWSLIPTFAERRMSAGLPISLLPMPDYDEGSAWVQQIYQTTNAREAWLRARGRGIDYLYLDHLDRDAYAETLDKFDTQPAYFERVFHNGDVTIYRVR